MVSQSGMLRITYVKSAIGYSQKQKNTVRSLGLRRLGGSIVQPDNGAIRGMIAAIDHLVSVEALPPAEIQAQLSSDSENE